MHGQADGFAEELPRSGAPTLVRLTSSGVRVLEGRHLVLSATVRTVEGGTPAATGSVEFRAGERLLGVAALDATGLALLRGVLLAPGLHALTASYSGDRVHAGASSPPLPQAVTAAGAPVVLLVAAPALVPDGIQLEAELVDPHTGRVAEDATGRLVFSAGSATVAAVDLVAGHARTVVSRLPAGNVHATFAGDAEHAPASGAFQETVAGA